MYIQPVSAWSVQYHIGPETDKPSCLRSAWKDYNVCIGENKIFLVTQGEFIIRTKSGETLCRAGDLVFIPAGLKHDYYLAQSGYAEKFWFHFTLLHNQKTVFSSFRELIRFPADGNSLTPLFQTACKAVKTDADAANRAGAVFAIAAYLLSHAAPTNSNALPDEIDNVVHYINEHLADELCLHTLAKIAHLSPNYFVRKFHKRTGMSPMKYLTYARIELAKKQLLYTGESINSVMQNIGIYDAAYFSRLFKNATGYSPRAYRSLLGQAPKDE